MMDLDFTDGTVATSPDSDSACEAQATYLESFNSQLTDWDDPCARLTRAMRDDEFLLYGQKIIPLTPRGGPRSIVEILVRLNEEEQNLTPPGAFLPVMEYYNLMPALDRWILDHAIAWCASRSAGTETVCSINLAESTISDIAFTGFIRERLAAYNVSPRMLCFEIPENDVVTKTGVRFLTKIKAIGCLFAIGSFGRDIVSFKSLRSVNASFIKIDGNIVREITHDPVAAAKVQAIAKVCDQQGIASVAEFVETPDILDKLREMGVNYAQGYGISKPGPLDALA